MKPSKKRLYPAALALAASIASFIVPSLGHAATVVLTENFNSFPPAGWLTVNNSVPTGQSWFQGNTDNFSAQAGPATSYAAANFLSANAGLGTVDNWLITPVLTLSGATALSFYTRSAGASGFNDLLELRFSPGSGSDTGGFSTLLATVGGSAAYPDAWQRIVANLDVNGAGRFAFHYLGAASTSNYIGIDTVSVTTAVPEPASYAMLLMGLAALPLLRNKRNPSRG